MGEQPFGKAGRSVATRRQQVGAICPDLVREAREAALHAMVDRDRGPHRRAVVQVGAVDEAVEEHRHQRRGEPRDDARHPDVDEHGEDTEHDAAAQERELEVVARPLAAATLVSEGEPPVHRGVPGGAEREGRDEGDQRVEAGDPDEDREHRQEHAEPAEADQAELPDPRGTRDVEEQRPEVSQVEESLASGRLAHALGAGRLGHRHVDDAQVRNADEQLEQDLETDRTELDPVDQGAAAEEEARERDPSSGAPP